MFEHLYKSVKKKINHSNDIIDMMSEAGWYKIGMEFSPSLLEKFQMFSNNFSTHAFYSYYDDVETNTFGFVSVASTGQIIDSMAIGFISEEK